MPVRLVLILLLTAFSSSAAFKLFLVDGGDMTVREYEVQGERVRYYSVERSQWEEIPLELVDIERTERMADRDRKRREALRAESAREREAERKARTELHNVPVDEGIYHYLDDTATALEQAEVVVDSSAKRTFFQVISPIPAIAGKRTMNVEGETSKFVVHESKPVFYVRQSNLGLFGLVKVEPDPKKKRRIVQVIQVVPQTQEIFEEEEEIEVFRQQLARGVYRVWPVKPLTAGEYAIIDYNPGAEDLRVWDFSCRPGDVPAEESDQNDGGS